MIHPVAGVFGFKVAFNNFQLYYDQLSYQTASRQFTAIHPVFSKCLGLNNICSDIYLKKKYGLYVYEVCGL